MQLNTPLAASPPQKSAAPYAWYSLTIYRLLGTPSSLRRCLTMFWCLLARGEDYAFAQPSLTKKKMRRLELQAGAPRRQGGRGIWSTNDAMRHAESELALQGQRAYERTISDRQASKAGAGATPGRASQRPSSGTAARQTSKPQRSAL